MDGGDLTLCPLLFKSHPFAMLRCLKSIPLPYVAWQNTIPNVQRLFAIDILYQDPGTFNTWNDFFGN